MIGPTFLDELEAAGVPLDGIAWGSDGKIEYREDVPQAVRDQVAAVLKAHDPSKPAPGAPTISDGDLAKVLVAQGVVTQASIDAAIAAKGG